MGFWTLTCIPARRIHYVIRLRSDQCDSGQYRQWCSSTKKFGGHKSLNLLTVWFLAAKGTCLRCVSDNLNWNKCVLSLPDQNTTVDWTCYEISTPTLTTKLQFCNGCETGTNVILTWLYIDLGYWHFQMLSQYPMNFGVCVPHSFCWLVMTEKILQYVSTPKGKWINSTHQIKTDLTRPCCSPSNILTTTIVLNERICI